MQGIFWKKNIIFKEIKLIPYLGVDSKFTLGQEKKSAKYGCFPYLLKIQLKDRIFTCNKVISN